MSQWVYGHRGASGYAPENTLEAFELAAKQGAHGVELDVHLSRDGELVVAHGFFGFHKRLATIDAYAAKFALHGDDCALQKIGFTDKIRHKFAVGVVVDIHGVAHLRDFPFVHDDDGIADGHSLALVMGYIDCRNAQRLLNAADFRAHTYAQLRVQVGKRLVKQEHARFHHQGARQRDALLLAAGKLVGHGKHLECFPVLYHRGMEPRRVADLLRAAQWIRLP